MRTRDSSIALSMRNEEDSPSTGLSIAHGKAATAAAEKESRSNKDNNLISHENEPNDGIQTAAMAPSVSKILTFAVPAIGVWLCSPLLSMIDTATVGMFCGTAQQAALNPSVAIIDYSARCMSFLFTGTTNLLAIAQESDKDLVEKPTTTQAMLGALQLSFYVGTLLGLSILCFTQPLLRLMVGNTAGISKEVLDAAARYVRIRALSMPATAWIGSAQAACLGMQDVRSPLRIVLAAAGVNAIADFLLVPSGGAAGAAWATTIAQYAAVGMFVRWLWRKDRNDETKKAADIVAGEQNKQKGPAATKAPRFSTKGFFLNNRVKLSDVWKLPTRQTWKRFSPFVVPVTTTQVGRCSVYVAMGNTVSSAFGETAMAAQQIICSFFYTLIPIADSLSLTAQSFLPSIVQTPNVISLSSSRSQALERRARTLQKTLLNFGKAAGLFGAALVSIVATIPWFVRSFFTTDAAVTSLVASVVPILSAVFAFHGVFCASEGILLAQKDLTFLGRLYAGYFVVVPYLMLRLKAKVALLGKEAVTLRSVWNIFLGYQCFRITAWVCRIIWLQYRINREAKNATTDQFTVTMKE